ncbi:hypothetical protein D3C79_758740 [compost metagenome]
MRVQRLEALPGAIPARQLQCAGGKFAAALQSSVFLIDAAQVSRPEERQPVSQQCPDLLGVSRNVEFQARVQQGLAGKAIQRGKLEMLQPAPLTQRRR